MCTSLLPWDVRFTAEMPVSAILSNKCDYAYNRMQWFQWPQHYAYDPRRVVQGCCKMAASHCLTPSNSNLTLILPIIVSLSWPLMHDPSAKMQTIYSQTYRFFKCRKYRVSMYSDCAVQLNHSKIYTNSCMKFLTGILCLWQIQPQDLACRMKYM